MTAAVERTGHGLIIGKFFPLHEGHLALIRFAAERSERLTVLLMASRLEALPLAARERWLRHETAALDGVRVLAVPCDAPVDYGTDIAWHAHTALMAAALEVDAAPAVTAVFTSEEYGAELAARFGAEHVPFDVRRARHPVSGTAIRDDLSTHWDAVAPSARLELATRVIVVGAESTGTTTLADDLAAHYRAHGFPRLREVAEYGRERTYELHAQASRRHGRDADMDELEWTTEDFAHIARVQLAREQEAALACPLVIADTDAFATQLWERRYVGTPSRGAAEATDAALPRRDVYLVTDHEGVPFEQDGWRDGEHVRSGMTRWFTSELTRRRASWVLLRGSRSERLAYARTLVDALWRSSSAFASPPWADRTQAPAGT